MSEIVYMLFKTKLPVRVTGTYINVNYILITSGAYTFVNKVDLELIVVLWGATPIYKLCDGEGIMLCCLKNILMEYKDKLSRGHYWKNI